MPYNPYGYGADKFVSNDSGPSGNDDGPRDPRNRIYFGHPLRSLTKKSHEPFRTGGRFLDSLFFSAKEMINDALESIPIIGFLFATALNLVFAAVEATIGLAFKTGSGIIKGLEWTVNAPMKLMNWIQDKIQGPEQSKEADKSKDKEKTEEKDKEKDKEKEKEASEEKEKDKEKEVSEEKEKEAAKETSEERTSERENAPESNGDELSHLSDDQLRAENQKLKEQIASIKEALQKQAAEQNEAVENEETNQKAESRNGAYIVWRNPNRFPSPDEPIEIVEIPIENLIPSEESLGMKFPASPSDKNYLTSPPEDVYGNYPSLGSNLRHLRDQSAGSRALLNNVQGDFTQMSEASQNKVADAMATVAFDQLLRHTRMYQNRGGKNKAGVENLKIEDQFVKAKDPEKFMNKWKNSVRENIKENLSKIDNLEQLKDNPGLLEKISTSALKSVYKETKLKYEGSKEIADEYIRDKTYNAVMERMARRQASDQSVSVR